MKLICKYEYHNAPAGLHFEPGVIEVEAAQADYLLRDAPENFFVVTEVAAVEVRAFDEAPEDKQVKRAPKRKAA